MFHMWNLSGSHGPYLHIFLFGPRRLKPLSLESSTYKIDVYVKIWKFQVGRVEEVEDFWPRKPNFNFKMLYFVIFGPKTSLYYYYLVNLGQVQKGNDSKTPSKKGRNTSPVGQNSDLPNSLSLSLSLTLSYLFVEYCR